MTEVPEPAAARAAAKLAAARARLILDKPFLGALVLRLPLVAAGAWCRTTATDARKLYYRPDWIAGLSTAELQFALAHEALHCALEIPLGQTYLIPVRLDECAVPEEIQREVQYVDLFPDFRVGFERIEETIRRQEAERRGRLLPLAG